MNRCAARHGVTIDLPTARQFPDDFLPLYGSMIRPVSIHEAKTLAYGFPPSSRPVVDEQIGSLPTADAEVVVGWNDLISKQPPSDPFLVDGGCAGEASRTLTANSTSGGSGTSVLGGDDSLVTDLISKSLALTMADSMMNDRMKSWSHCMAVAGYSGIQTTGDAVQALGLVVNSATVRQAEQDVSCKASTGFLQTWVRLVTSYQQRSLDQNSQQLAAVQQRLRAALTRAAAVLGSGT